MSSSHPRDWWVHFLHRWLLPPEASDEKQIDCGWFGGDEFDRRMFGSGYSCLSESYADGELGSGGVGDVSGALGVNGVYTTDDNHAP
jgi:hypothetical protein